MEKALVFIEIREASKQHAASHWLQELNFKMVRGKALGEWSALNDLEDETPSEITGRSRNADGEESRQRKEKEEE
ncbi:hypothetical protein QOT17_011695 [Balamuthia mandrillaris]